MISWRRSIYIFAMISLAGFYHTSTGIHLNRQTLTGNILGWRYFFFQRYKCFVSWFWFLFWCKFQGDQKKNQRNNAYSMKQTPHHGISSISKYRKDISLEYWKWNCWIIFNTSWKSILNSNFRKQKKDRNSKSGRR